jgi:holo-[acyl-carrier protein] synthase
VAGPGRQLIGLGHDLQLISEVARASALREPGVFFTSAELRGFASALVPSQSLAGGFAAKEGLFKALPADVTWFWTDAELIPDRHGAPRFRMHGRLAEQLARRRIQVSVSISHSGGFVSSVVLVSGDTPRSGHIFAAMNRTVRHALQRVTAHRAGASQ